MGLASRGLDGQLLPMLNGLFQLPINFEQLDRLPFYIDSTREHLFHRHDGR